MARTRNAPSGSSKRTRGTSGGSSKRSRSASGKSSQAGRSTKTSAARTSRAASRSTSGKSGTSGGNRSSTAASSRRPDELKKEELVEQIGKHLRRLRRDDLVALVERLDAGTLDLPTLAPSGEGGFGFQEQTSGVRSRVGGSAEKSASKAGSLAKRVVESPVVERVKEKVTPS